MNNVNNRIANTDGFTESHEDERRLSPGNHRGRGKRSMTMCSCRTKALHETEGDENFGIIKMMDKEGNSPPEDTIECIKVWFHDRQGQFKTMVERSNFWFRNGQLCKQFFKENGMNWKHWKRTKEARTLELRLLLNSQAEDDDM